jgi:hypothetical protein
MVVTYSTAALVRKGTKWLSGELVDADVEEYIYQAEGVIDGVMKLRYDPGCFPLLEEAEMTENLAYYSALRALTLLADTRVVDYLIALT